MKESRRKVLIPTFSLTELCDAGDPRGSNRSIHQGKGREAFSYRHRPVIDPITLQSRDYNLFPVVLTRTGAPWSIATNYLLSKLEAESRPNMNSYVSQAEDLGAYREWLDEHSNPDELLFYFPKNKQARATYRYRSHLMQKIYAREIAPSTAKRRMGVVISLYRWMIDQKLFEPDFSPWQERQYLLSLKSTHGLSMLKPVASTDISIKAPKGDDPFAGWIQDGGKLRPLTVDEQQWVMEAARALGNTEMQLLILFMLLTGARIQTACTLRVRHFTGAKPHFCKALSGDFSIFKLPIGPQAGIDTKHDKSMVLQVPRTLYEVMHNYALSDRATRRRQRSSGGDTPDQYLFLTQQGSPYFTSKDEALAFNPGMQRRHRKTGGTVRQYLKDHLIPYVRRQHDKTFHFRVHDLRASFGMNQTDIQMALVEKGEITLYKARIVVMALMGHASSATTDLYLDYRKQMEQARAAINGYGEQVQRWIADAMAGIGYDDE